MDAIDRAILAELQADGRLTVTELADRVRLTPGPCHRRLRELERSGVITGYRALVDPAAVGMGFEALVQVTLDRGDAATVTAFEAAIIGLPQVRHAERLFEQALDLADRAPDRTERERLTATVRGRLAIARRWGGQTPAEETATGDEFAVPAVAESPTA